MNTHTFHILASLARADGHGSEIARQVSDATGGAVQLWPVTLYRTLDQLVEDGLIRELVEGERPEGASRKRRYYRLTDEGARSLEAEAERIEAFAQLARRNLEDGPWRD